LKSLVQQGRGNHYRERDGAVTTTSRSSSRCSWVGFFALATTSAGTNKPPSSRGSCCRAATARHICAVAVCGSRRVSSARRTVPGRALQAKRSGLERFFSTQKVPNPKVKNPKLRFGILLATPFPLARTRLPAVVQYPSGKRKAARTCPLRGGDIDVLAASLVTLLGWSHT
jgi:hypothetical protein